MSFKCRECQQVFPSRRSLHAHIKKHGLMLGDYYVRFYQRRDKLTNELLPFKNYEDYFSRDFSHNRNRDKWLKEAPQKEVQKYLQIWLRRRVEKRGIDYAPSELELVSAGLPGVDAFKESFGSYTWACEGLGIKPRLDQPLPKGFWLNYNNEHIIIDTREKYPLKFPNSSSMKLDVGDYSVKPDQFDYTFVDRKSWADFGHSVGASFDRFHREFERCKSMGCYLFVLIEIEYGKVHEYNRKAYKKHNLNYIFAQMRELQEEFHDCSQFVFSGSRNMSELLAPKLLVLGQKTWKTDIHYHWQKFLKRED